MAAHRMNREVTKNVDKYSTFLQLIPKVQLLYGLNWRTWNNGKLSKASALTKTEVTMELPRLEFMIPEAMRHRRLFAIRRITELDHDALEEETA